MIRFFGSVVSVKCYICMECLISCLNWNLEVKEGGKKKRGKDEKVVN